MLMDAMIERLKIDLMQFNCVAANVNVLNSYESYHLGFGLHRFALVLVFRNHFLMLIFVRDNSNRGGGKQIFKA
jgi:hypothetical protein